MEKKALVLAELEGDTPLVLEVFKTAHSLDPEDEQLAAEVKLREERQRIVSARLAAAAAARAE